MNKVRYGRLITVAALTIYALLTIFGTESKKETQYDRRIRQLKAELGEMADSDPAKAVKKSELDKVEAGRLTTADAVKKAEELEQKLASMVKGSDEYSETERSLNVVKAQIPKWYDEFPLNLGLDLRGGTEVRLRISSKRMERKVAELTEKAAKLKPESKEAKENAEKLASASDQLNKNINHAVDIIRNRLNRQGLAEIPVTKEGANRIRVQLPGMDSETAKAVIDTIKTSGQLEFRLVIGKNDDVGLHDSIEKINPAPNTTGICLSHNRALRDDEITSTRRCKLHNEKIYDYLEEAAAYKKDGTLKDAARLHILLQEENPLTGDHIEMARVTTDQNSPGKYAVSFELDMYGAKRFSRLTSENKGKSLAIILDGKLRSAPNIKDAITTGSGIITGNFSAAEAKNLTVILREGSLPVDIEVELENTVGPTLGEDSIARGMQAIVGGLVLMLVFMLVYYLISGVITNFGLIINMIFILSILIGFSAALTLPGIAGLILTVGMAVDANVLIFERIREELKKGMSLSKAVDNGYDRAFVTIVDANITTLITAFILMGYGTDAVVGFGTMLTIGILTSMFTSLFVTRAFFHLILDLGIIKEKLTMCRVVGSPNVDFVKLCKPVAGLSVALIIAGLVVFVGRGQDNFSHDLSGGTLAHVNLTEEVTVNDARTRLAGLGGKGFEDISIQSFGLPGKAGYTSFVLRTKQVDPEGESGKNSRTAADFKKAIAEILPVVSDGITNIGSIELTKDGQPVWEFVLNLTNARTVKEVSDALLTSELGNVYVRTEDMPRPEEKSLEAAVTMAIAATDKNGKGLKEPAQLKAKAEELLKALNQDILSAEKAVQEIKASVLPASSAAEVMVEVSLKLEKAVTADQLKSTLLKSDGITSVTVKMVKLPAPAAASDKPVGKVIVMCTVPALDATGKPRVEASAQEQFIRSQLGALRADNVLSYTEPFSRFTSVGPMVAGEMKNKAILALIYSMVAIFFYIWLRFQFRAAFGLGACLALIHDVLFTIGVISIADQYFGLNIQIDLTIVAALLTIVGYSLNDTIVVFDRIRENLSIGGNSLTEIINRSINQTLSRTILTSVTTLLVVSALLLWGGEVIRGFAFSLFVGVLVGTFSSIFIAAPVLVYMADIYNKHKEKKQLEEKAAKS
ncbi:MAG: protein translocase subunit SecD [Planctomycetota bacterium]|jgi:SecD/SecF fusion protein